MNRPSPAELVLVDGDTSITVRPRNANAGNPVMCKEWDLGTPDMRYTAVPRPGADGVDQGAGFLGSRQVALALQILGDAIGNSGGHDPYWYAQKLVAMTHPSRRPTLQITRDGGDLAGKTWSLSLRGLSHDLSYTRRSAAMLELTLNFVCPDGVLQGPLQSVQSPRAGGAGGGLVFPMHLPADFGHSSLLNPLMTITVGGAAPVWPTIYISGPCKNPRLRDEQGNEFVFAGLTLLSGELVQIDMSAGTVMKAGTGTTEISDDDSVYHLVDFATSTFWQWQPGVHTVRYIATGGTATVQWRDRALTI